MAFGFESPAWVRDARADSWGKFEKSGHSFRREIIGQAVVIGYVPIRRFPMSGYATYQAPETNFGAPVSTCADYDVQEKPRANDFRDCMASRPHMPKRIIAG